MERTLSRTCIIIVLLLFQIFLTSLAFGETPKPTTGVSPCKITFEDHAAHLVNFENGEDALDFLTRAVASGYPVMVYLNIYYVYDDFSQSS